MTVQWWGVLPFAGLLACIATFPLLPKVRDLWHHVWFQFLTSILFGVPVAVWFALSGGSQAVGHALVEYAQFICLLTSLFVISGGIFLAGDIRATPRNNTIFLTFGALIASLVGTTGAAMLLIRPVLNTNAERKHKAHTVIFLIFIVANCGGLLTPLGDPPLFLGMLRGVPFAWTLTLFPEWLFVNGMLLATYYCLDRRQYARETDDDVAFDDTSVVPLHLRGRHQLALLALIVIAVALVPSVDADALTHGTASASQLIPWRELLMIAASVASLFTGSRATRYEYNSFEWGPIKEVAALFLGIFLAMVPALRYLSEVAPKLPLNEMTFFLFTGGLSSLLDNAPTYATFFEMARTLPGEHLIAGVPVEFLSAISLGAVLCGAMTYIGNGPNFMVRSVAVSRGVNMPTFGGYVGWSLTFLAPVLAAMALIFIAGGWWIVLGAAIVVVSLGRVALQTRGTPASR